MVVAGWWFIGAAAIGVNWAWGLIPYFAAALALLSFIGWAIGKRKAARAVPTSAAIPVEAEAKGDHGDLRLLPGHGAS